MCWAPCAGCHPRSARDIPVVYITVPPAAIPKMIAMEFARFFDLPLCRRGNITNIADGVCGESRAAHITLVAVDELHNLNTATGRDCPRCPEGYVHLWVHSGMPGQRGRC